MLVVAVIDSVCQGSPADPWEQHHDHMGVARYEFDQYLSGVSTAYLLLLNGASRLDSPLLSDQQEGAISWRAGGSLCARA